MTPFTVEWETPAEDELCRLWMQTNDPAAVTRSQAQIDQLLAHDPLGNGKHMSEGLYAIDVAPLRANYTVNAKQRHAKVSWVKVMP
jgi:hypothetical protein